MKRNISFLTCTSEKLESQVVDTHTEGVGRPLYLWWGEYRYK